MRGRVDDVAGAFADDSAAPELDPRLPFALAYRAPRRALAAG